MALVIAHLGLSALPARASGLPPLDLAPGHGTVGLGFFQVAGDVAITPGLTVGGALWTAVVMEHASVRVAWTAAASPRWGSLGLLSGASRESWGSLSSVSSNRVSFGWFAGPVYESPRGFVRLRAGAIPTWRFQGDLASGLLVMPYLELLVPILDVVELTVGGNSALGLYARW